MLEERNMELVNALQIFQSALRKISVAYGDIGRKVQKKCDHIVANNPDLKTVENIRDIIVGEEVDMERTFAQHAMYFKFAPVTSVEVERSFSKLNMLLTEHRLSIKTENVKNFLLISCNS